jgi:hypothetical protein
VRRYLGVQANKVTAVEGYHRSTSRHRLRHDSGVCNAQTRLVCLMRGENVGAKFTQALDHRRTTIFISVETGHRLCFRRPLDGLLNLFAMDGIVSQATAKSANVRSG